MTDKTLKDNLKRMLNKGKSCDRKKGYDTVEQARKALAYVWTQTGANLKVYKCQFCGKYHLTHKLDFDTGAVEGASQSVFASSPNFSGTRKPEVWDHNNLELRKKRREERAERAKMEREAARPAAPVVSEEAKIEKPEFVIDPEAYITGKNRHKHKVAALRKIVYCRKCRRPIQNLDATRLCEECRKEQETIEAMASLDGTATLCSIVKNPRKRH